MAPYLGHVIENCLHVKSKKERKYKKILVYPPSIFCSIHITFLHYPNIARYSSQKFHKRTAAHMKNTSTNELLSTCFICFSRYQPRKFRSFQSAFSPFIFEILLQNVHTECSKPLYNTRCYILCFSFPSSVVSSSSISLPSLTISSTEIFPSVQSRIEH